MKIEDIKLDPVLGSKYGGTGNKLATLYANQEKLLEAIKLLNADTPPERRTLGRKRQP